jgi:hypothetical protein
MLQMLNRTTKKPEIPNNVKRWFLHRHLLGEANPQIWVSLYCFGKLSPRLRPAPEHRSHLKPYIFSRSLPQADQKTSTFAPTLSQLYQHPLAIFNSRSAGGKAADAPLSGVAFWGRDFFRPYGKPGGSKKDQTGDSAKLKAKQN